jgi:muconolactone delta-isomerase
VEKLFYIKPGVGPSKIQVQLDGVKDLKLSKDGEIIIQTGLGELKLSKPIAWQEKDGKKLPVEVSYKLVGKNRYSFEVAKADPSLPIVIDPILQATYLGGGGWDIARALAIHPTTGEVYVTGWTDSANFPKTTGGAQSKYIFNLDVFVARLNSDLTQILQSTYLAGYVNEAYALAIHPQTGEVYVAGFTRSPNFPKTTGGAQAKYGGGNSDAFVARLNSDLTQLLQSTYLGGSSDDAAYALAIHPKTGEVYVAGYTSQIWFSDFPRTAGGAQANYGGGFEDAFVARLNKELTQILQSTYLGGRHSDVAYALAIHPKTGEVYVAGYTRSLNFPRTAGGAQAKYGGAGSTHILNEDAFVARLNPELTQILQSTYLGGNGDDRVNALAIHPKTGDVYVAGLTESTNLPKTTGGAQRGSGGDIDAFVASLNSTLTRLLQSTYLGGNGDDRARNLTIHPTTGDIYVAGYTNSTNFPKTTGVAQNKYDEVFGRLFPDAFVARLNSNLTSILESTLLGGSYNDEAYALAIHPQTGEVYVAGFTRSPNFPITTGGAQASFNGGADAFVARLSAELAAGRSSAGGGGYHITGSAPSLAGVWNILLLLSVPAFVVARRIRGR